MDGIFKPYFDWLIVYTDDVFWWEFLNLDDKVKTYYTRLRFSAIGHFQRFRQCKWFKDWWTDYGMNRTAMDPIEHEKYCKNLCRPCIEQCSTDFNHPTYNTIKQMTEGEWSVYKSSLYNNSLEEHMREHMEWLVLTKVQYQIVLGKSMIFRKI